MMAAADGSRLIYCYGILPTADAASLDGDRLSKGLSEAPVYLLSVGPLSAAVSAVPEEQFSEEALNRLASDLVALAPYAVRHEEVVRALGAPRVPVLPMKFGTVYRSEAAVEGMLRSRSNQLVPVLDELRGKAEWTVKVYAEARALTAAAATASPTLRSLGVQADAAAPGKAYLLRRQMERLAGGEAERVLSEIVDELLDRLSTAAVRVQRDEVASTPGAELQLVAKAAFLVADRGEAHFDATLAEVTRDVATLGVTLERTGPWAPYSFAEPAPA